MEHWSYWNWTSDLTLGRDVAVQALVPSRDAATQTSSVRWNTEREVVHRHGTSSGRRHTSPEWDRQIAEEEVIVDVREEDIDVHCYGAGYDEPARDRQEVEDAASAYARYKSSLAWDRQEPEEESIDVDCYNKSRHWGYERLLAWRRQVAEERDGVYDYLADTFHTA